jgi:hypothetical protein
VFFDDLIPKAIQSIPNVYKGVQKSINFLERRILKKTKEKEIIEIEIKFKTKKIFSDILLIFTFLGSSALFYYFNWILIINTRFLHPLYLLILFIIISLLIHPSFYLSLVKASSYKMIWTDLVYIYKQSFNGITSFFRTIQRFFVGTLSKIMNLFRASEQEEMD